MWPHMSLLRPEIQADQRLTLKTLTAVTIDLFVFLWFTFTRKNSIYMRSYYCERLYVGFFIRCLLNRACLKCLRS